MGEAHEPEGYVVELEDNPIGVRGTLIKDHCAQWQVMGWRPVAASDRIALEVPEHADGDDEFVITRDVATWLAAQLLRAVRASEGEEQVPMLESHGRHDNGVLLRDLVARLGAAETRVAELERELARHPIVEIRRSQLEPGKTGQHTNGLAPMWVRFQAGPWLRFGAYRAEAALTRDLRDLLDVEQSYKCESCGHGEFFVERGFQRCKACGFPGQ